VGIGLWNAFLDKDTKVQADQIVTANIRRLVLVLAGLMVVLTAGCAPPQKTARHYKEVTATGIIRQIDRQERRVVLQVNLQKVTLRVAPSVTRFDNLEVGDRLRFLYRYAWTARLADPDDALRPPETELKLSAPSGDVPGNVLVRTRRFEAEFVDMDHQSKITTLHLPDDSYAYFIAPLRLQGFLSVMSPGTGIYVVIQEAIAISVVPLSGGPFSGK